MVCLTWSVKCEFSKFRLGRAERDSNPDLYDAGAVLHQLNYLAKWELDHNLEPRSDQFPVGLIAEMVKHCTGIAEVRVRIPFRPESFFRPSSLLHK